ncbi:glycosyltransferase family 2 protein [[Clostridium] scindens]|uniref:glycosyltransferase family 2 protein n=1 Tax=Clostridium scindens (strain JCM 10418 / VPI 12708) TaxID=29347 RepID=UPI001C709F12|nr:glycosyltransferase [[Clostridium] scindens]QYX25929.1 glycosyltransferase [[Clostridium] scindens]
MEKVTIWLTSYNHERFLGPCIESVLNQTYKDFQLFIVDDCSSDNSWNIITKYAKLDKRITVIRHEFNQGGSGLKDQVENLPGEYIAIVHSDDIWENTKLEKQIRVLDNNKEIAACFTKVKFIDDEGIEYSQEFDQEFNIFEQPNRNRFEWLHYFFYHRNCLCHPSVLIRKEVYIKYGIISSGLHGYPDFFQWVRLCKYAEIYIIQERLVGFRKHRDESNTSGERMENIKRIHTEEIFVLREYKGLLESHEVLNVFPECKKYIINGEMVEEFALAQMFLTGPGHAHWLIGLEILYEIFQDREKVRLIQEKYNYSSKSFNIDKQKYDLFNIINPDRCLDVTLFFNTGKGYNIKECIKKKVFIQHLGRCIFTIQLDDFQCNDVVETRLDLDEGRYRRFNIVSLNNNGKKVDILGSNCIKKEEWDTFYTSDPQYFLSSLEPGELKVEVYTELIELQEIEQYYNNVNQQKSELLSELDKIKESKFWKLYSRVKRLKG